MGNSSTRSSYPAENKLGTYWFSADPLTEEHKNQMNSWKYSEKFFLKQNK